MSRRGSHCFSPTSGRTIIVGGGGSDCEETSMYIWINPRNLLLPFVLLHSRSNDFEYCKSSLMNIDHIMDCND